MVLSLKRAKSIKRSETGEWSSYSAFHGSCEKDGSVKATMTHSMVLDHCIFQTSESVCVIELEWDVSQRAGRQRIGVMALILCNGRTKKKVIR